MASRDAALGMIFLSQTVFGILGNFSLLHHYLFLYSTGRGLRSTDLILKHLVVAKSLVLFSKGVPQTMAAFGLKDFLNDTGCKLVFYLHRVARGVSISSTCLFSIFQAITISLRNSRWAELKLKSSKHIGSFICLCWILHTLASIIFPMYVTSKWNNTNTTVKKDFGYCSGILPNKITQSLHAALLSISGVFCLGLMLWASGSTIYIRYRHKQRVQHIHRTNASSRSSLESRATQSILVLVSTFVSFYTFSTIFQVYIALYNNPSSLLVNISAFINECFPIVSPFVLMTHGFSVYSLCFVWIRNTKSPNLIRNI
ncbi:PREDICTED: vomeronasal type-1 receptor 4-like [Ceratotherium simum simum]|uniref:Vomeronasal type-1 receptor n=1 Tax=Ceratotherium simum simum TaxID=73337 RepID=A0ABM0I2U0_CERSS|nr:PREDICTED: vomeronasal type-1 receptor 4-like [Ceratotherium simum simum]